MNKKEEIFTIGDKTTLGIITCFRLLDNEIMVDFDNNNSILLKSKQLQKVKQPLFTTEDGVDIFEGDVVTVVSLKDFKEGDCDGENDTPIEAYSITWKNKIISSYNWNLRKDNFLQFSTKEKAEEYILMHKPCLSLKDIDELLCKNTSSYFLEKFKKLVQQKLNK